jgi:aminocarboxymuconate-semialdehyde decarboxylase
MLLPRLQQAMAVFPALKDSVQRSPTEQARALYYDTLVFDQHTLAHLVQTFGASQLMIGTDYPFNFHDKDPVERIQNAGLDDKVIQQLTHANAKRFLGIDSKNLE